MTSHAAPSVIRGACPLLAFALASCAASATPPPAANPPADTPPLHAHPGPRSMERAFARVESEALRCLRPGDVASVRGDFQGPTGRFHTQAITAPNGVALPYAIETCLRVAADEAHVREFGDPTAAYGFTFTAPAPAVSEASGASAGSLPLHTGGGTMEIQSRPSPADRIRREADALERCYEQACERDHTIAGSVELRFTLDAAGRITRFAARSQSTNEDATLMDLVARCIESHVRLIQFGPQSAAGIETVVPLAFRPGGIPID